MNLLRVTTTLFIALGFAACLEAPDSDWNVEPQDSLETEAICVGCGVDDDDGGSSADSCSATCSSATACDIQCRGSNGSLTTCGAYGVCRSCASHCSSSTKCDSSCRLGNSNSSCADYGVCQQCSQAVCSSPGACTKDCKNGPNGAVVECTTWSDAFLDDADLDRVPDSFEAALADKFAPRLGMSFNSLYLGCTDSEEFYGFRDEPHTILPYVVRPVTTLSNGWCAQGECIEIVYGLPYNYDLGDPETGYQYNHPGDSELYAVLVAHKPQLSGASWGTSSHTTALSSTDYWRSVRGFTAAHMCEENLFCTGPDSSAFHTDPAAGLDGGRDLFIAEGKHASYFGLTPCDNGGCNHSDWCGNPAGPGWQFHLLTPLPGEKNKLTNVGDQLCNKRFDTKIASPTAVACNWSPSGTQEIWSVQKFGKATGWLKKLRSNVINWGAQSYKCN